MVDSGSKESRKVVRDWRRVCALCVGNCVLLSVLLALVAVVVALGVVEVPAAPVLAVTITVVLAEMVAMVLVLGGTVAVWVLAVSLSWGGWRVVW